MLRGDEQVLRAELYRDGLVIAFLAARPLRLKNMMGLEIGTNFLLTAIFYVVDLAAEETKTHASPRLPHARQAGAWYERGLVQSP